MVAGAHTGPPAAVLQPVAMGRPGGGYPWAWSINRWLVGVPAILARVDDLTAFAVGLADFLIALQAIEAADGPPAGPHSAHRGGPLAYFDDEEIPQAIELIADQVDVDTVGDVWRAALASLGAIAGVGARRPGRLESARRGRGVEFGHRLRLLSSR